jgi:phosphoadenosine phosphosulfate reductase
MSTTLHESGAAVGNAPEALAPAAPRSPAAADARYDTLVATLREIAADHPDVVLASSLAAEDMVLTHAIFANDIPIEIFTLDTGRLNPETLGMIDTITAHYGKTIRVVRPDPAAVDQYVTEHGANAFYESVPLRKACCEIRKVVPLRGALAGHSAWITGQRREQAVTRGDLPEREHDPVFGLEKYNPLVLWTQDDVWQTLRRLRVPTNPLHDRGYPSIGCEPCTRAIRPGEDLRAGRWWWESSDSKECGLHAGNVSAIPVSVDFSKRSG